MNIFWPEGMNPKDYPVRSYNSLFVTSPPEIVWKKLVLAGNWPTWYFNCQDIKIDGDFLSPGKEFKWQTFFINVKSKVVEWKENESLGWTAKEFLASGYHGFRLIPQNGGTLVITEEVQRGLFPSLFPKLIKSMLEKEHQNWLIGLGKI